MRRHTWPAAAIGIACALSGCATRHASGHGTVEDHERAAASNAEIAAAHATAADDTPACADAVDINATCWTDTGTRKDHDRMARLHARIAEKHQQAADDLRNAEAEACAGIAEADRDISPFARWRDIAGTELLDASAATTKGPIPVARITFERIEGLDAPRLQRVIDCHVARNAALGNDVPEMDDCPLVPAGVRATASVVGGRIAVTIDADQASYAEVRRRLALLAQRQE